MDDCEGRASALAELTGCPNGAIRARLTRALAESRLTPHGLLLLRHQYGLTWARLDVFVEYYLTNVETIAQSLEPERMAVARRLGLSVNTVKHHLTSVRHALGLGARRGSATILFWALTEGISRLPTLPGSHLEQIPGRSDLTP